MKKNITHILQHIVIVLLSAAVAFSLPHAIRYVSGKVLASVPLFEHEELLAAVSEAGIAVLLIVLINSLIRGRSARNRSRTAQIAGMQDVVVPASFLARRRVRKLKFDQGFGRNVMVISSTGYRTITDPAGDLHDVLMNCREAKIMLLDPLKQGVVVRARSLGDPAITAETLREQIIRSIDFLKQLKARQKHVTLKLYPDVPFVKLAILGDYLCMQHYPAGRNVQTMPEYVFRHDGTGNLFGIFYQYFVTRWLDPHIPEYDLGTDELVYRDKAGREVRREQFNETVMEV